MGYSVVGEFIIQSENGKQIGEAINILKNWNQEWKPRFFIIDYSEAEMQAIEETFSETKVYICDFHKEQASEHWCKVIIQKKIGLDQRQMFHKLLNFVSFGGIFKQALV